MSDIRRHTFRPEPTPKAKFLAPEPTLGQAATKRLLRLFAIFFATSCAMVQRVDSDTMRLVCFTGAYRLGNLSAYGYKRVPELVGRAHSRAFVRACGACSPPSSARCGCTVATAKALHHAAGQLSGHPYQHQSPDQQTSGSMRVATRLVAAAWRLSSVHQST